MKKKKKNPQTDMRCPYCRRPVQIRHASFVYGDNNLNKDSYLYVCNGFPTDCDAYVGAHKGSLKPMGTLADGSLRHKRIEAHRALDQIWQEGHMTRHGVYDWLAFKLGLREKDMHIGMFSDYYCNKVIQECNNFINERHMREDGKCA